MCFGQKNQPIPFTVAHNYFVKNTYNKVDLVGNKICSKALFDNIFGMATVMGKDGKPTTIDFKKQFVIVVINKVSDIPTELIPKKLELLGKNRLNFTYEIKTGNKGTAMMQAFTMIIVDKKYSKYKVERTNYSITAQQADHEDKKVGHLPLANQWIIERFNTGSVSKFTKQSFITIDKTLKTFSGQGGCNGITGELVIKNDAISFQKIASTMMYCDNMEQEQLFTKNLEATNKYKIVGGELFLYKDNTLLMTLESFK
jgi:heat shock protein HslJ